MKVNELLADYSDEDLDRLARDKVDEVLNLRLPRQVLIQEIASALSSLSYVAKTLAPTRPPTYAFLKLLLDAPDYSTPVQGFRDAVLAQTDELTQRAEDGQGLSQDKNYQLYLRILYAAWEDDRKVDRSEALLLAALRNELGLWMREHLLLEHHPLVRPLWESERDYEAARNYLLSRGLVLVHQSAYALAEEVAGQIRRHWEIDLGDAAYRRLLELLTHNQLHDALDEVGLPLSGSKEERIERLVRGLVPPGEVLDTLHINEVRDLCRQCSLLVSAAKDELIAGLVDHFDRGEDLLEPVEEEPAPPAPPAPEPRELEDAELRHLLQQLTVDLLYDILAGKDLRRSGSKESRIERLVSSPWSEISLLKELRRSDLVSVCRKIGIPVSGVKRELIERLVEWAGAPAEKPLPTVEEELETEAESAPPSPPATEAPSVRAPEREARKERPASYEPPDAQAEPPAALEEIRARFPGLEPDQQVILALLKEARSLTEAEIRRASEQHELGWFLTKAHMADLLARLRQLEANPVRLRSSGQTNLYEWHGTASDRADALPQRAARDIIDALRQGVVPERHLDRLVVGQESFRRHLTELLTHVRDGRSEFKFLRGPYGAGKTFLCSWLREQAFEAAFAVSTVRIGPDQPLSDLPIFFSGLVDGLRTPEKRDASALADILESWLLRIHRSTAATEGLPAFAPQTRERLADLVKERIEEELARLAGVDPGFAPALRAFYQARLEKKPDLAATALAWLRGSRALPADVLRSIGVRGHLSAEEVFPRMRALLQVIAEGALEGLLLLVDELELVRRFPRARQRERAYETLRLLVDESGENDLPGCLLVCTGTDQLFEDERYGLPSYPALANRVRPPRETEGPASVRQPILQLEPLDHRRLRLVAERVREIHGLAYDWPAADRVPQEVLERMVEDSTSFGGERIERLPRPFLRELVHLLDLCEERPEIPAEDYLIQPTAEGDAAESILRALES